MKTAAQRHAQRTAQRLANDAKLAGKLRPRKRCERCKQCKPLDMHHPRYSEPLTVVWLCRFCHNITHQQMRAAGISAFDTPAGPVATTRAA